jgi:alpha-beta hydrolase superfamily lysophospholipase
MEHIEGTFKANGIGKLFYQGWLPEGEVRAVVMVVHGLGDHSGRYLNVVNQLVPAGYAVYGIDHIGHGRSDGTRLYLNRFEDFTVPLNTYREMIRQWHPGKKIFLFGHSMGGLIAAFHLIDVQDQFTAAVISAPLVQVPDNITPLTRFVATALSLLLPKVQLAGVDPAGISRDPAVVEAYVEDPLVCHGKTTARLGNEMLKAMQRVAAERGSIRLPVLVFHGGDDPLVPIDGTRKFAAAMGSADKTYREYPDRYHETFNDLGKEEVLADLQAWLDAH